MRTTVRLNESLLEQAKGYAAENSITLTALIEEALRKLLASKKRSSENKKKVKLLVSSARGGVREGIDLDDLGSLYDLMDEV